MKTDDLRKRVDSLIAQADELLKTTVGHNASGIISSRNSTYTSVNTELYQLFRTASLSFIDKVFGADHTYYKEFVKCVDDHSPSEVVEGRGILKAVKQEIDEGWLITVKGIVSAEIFTDFLEMANHLRTQGYKDSAAVMVGGVLEEHLRQMCINNGIPNTVTSPKDGKESHKTSDRMNNELAAAGVYGKLYQKSVTSWLDLRNKAAHGHFEEYDQRQVELMESGVLDFITKTTL